MSRDGKHLFINGQWRRGGSSAGAEVVNPADGTTLLQLGLSDKDDIDDAIAAAAQAFKTWRSEPPARRGALLKKAAAGLAARKEALARSLSLEQGKPLAESMGELDRTIETFEWCGEEATRSYGRVYPQSGPGLRQLTIKQPLGPVAAFAPWNFPAVLSARKIAPALAAGCSIVMKPAEETPGVCLGMFEVLEEAGFPAGVANLVFGDPAEVSTRLLGSPQIKKVSLTGSTAVGKELVRLSAEGMINATMELGGHAPVIVFDDTDAAKAAEMTAAFKYRNAGQVCLAPSRVYVHEAVLNTFVDRFIEVSESLVVGDGLDPTTQMGPLANTRRLQAVLGLIEDARRKGARIASGGGRIGSRGNFLAPTVIVDAPEAAAVLQSEPFGPLLPILPFSNFDEVMERANNSPFGLAAYAFTESLATATAFADEIEAGWVGVNNFSPFLANVAGGGVKQSGIGYEGGIEGMDAYMHTKFVSQTSLAPAGVSV